MTFIACLSKLDIFLFYLKVPVPHSISRGLQIISEAQKKPAALLSQAKEIQISLD